MLQARLPRNILSDCRYLAWSHTCSAALHILLLCDEKEQANALFRKVGMKFAAWNYTKCMRKTRSIVSIRKEKLMRKVLKVVESIGKVLMWVAIVALIIMVGVTFADIILKQFFSRPVTGSIELTRMMLICMSVAFMSAMVNKRHVSVGLFVGRLRRKGQIFFDTISYSLSTAICLVICHQSFVVMLLRMDQGKLYTVLRIPTWPFYMIFSIAMLFFAVAIVVYLIDIYLDKTRYAPVELESEKIGASEKGGAKI